MRALSRESVYRKTGTVSARSGTKYDGQILRELFVIRIYPVYVTYLLNMCPCMSRFYTDRRAFVELASYPITVSRKRAKLCNTNIAVDLRVANGPRINFVPCMVRLDARPRNYTEIPCSRMCGAFFLWRFSQSNVLEEKLHAYIVHTPVQYNVM